jgi:hypothetical protein
MSDEPRVREREPIERVRARLEALVRANAAPRCGARSKRTGKPCRGAAMPNGRCKIHGGKSTGPRTPEGLERSRRANWKHGHFSREAKAEKQRGRYSITEPIERVRARLEALVMANAAPRCGARSKRTGKPCRGAAMPNGRCKIHGGKSTGPRTPEGLERSRRANWKHGHFSREAKAERSRVRAAMLALRYLRDSI